MTALWGGRFEKGLDDVAVALSFSLDIDKRLYPYDILTNKAHAKGLHKTGYLSDDELKTLLSALDEVRAQLSEPGAFDGFTDEDIHSCVERLVTERCGDLGKKLHTGKSRNDQVLTDTKLFLKESLSGICDDLKALLKTVYGLAETHKERLFPGFTHFQPAQPVVLGHYFLAYFDQFKRDLDRLEHVLEQTDVCPLGSGALAGNNYGVDRDFMAQELGFSRVTTNSMDAISDRDFLMAFCDAAGTCMVHMSRLCEELVLWNSPLIGLVSIGDNYTTGSSLMPQKKNPDMAELIRGKVGRVLGHSVSLKTIMKALPLTYNRDLQEDKVILFDTVDTLQMSLACLAGMLQTVSFHDAVIDDTLKKGYLLATDFADYLVKKGVPFRESHEVTGKVVLFAIQEGLPLEGLSLDQFRSFSDLIEEDVYDALTLEAAVQAKSVIGGTGFEQVKQRLVKLKEDITWLNSH